MGICKETKGGKRNDVARAVSDTPNVFLDVLDTFTQFCAKTQVFGFANSYFQAIEPLTM